MFSNIKLCKTYEQIFKIKIEEHIRFLSSYNIAEHIRFLLRNKIHIPLVYLYFYYVKMLTLIRHNIIYDIWSKSTKILQQI